MLPQPHRFKVSSFQAPAGRSPQRVTGNRSCPGVEIGKVPQANKPQLDENLEIAARFGEPALTYYIKNMITLIKRITLLLAVTTVLAFAATGCNTAHGFGKDMEAAGDKIQEGTD